MFDEISLSMFIIILAGIGVVGTMALSFLMRKKFRTSARKKDEGERIKRHHQRIEELKKDGEKDIPSNGASS